MLILPGGQVLEAGPGPSVSPSPGREADGDGPWGEGGAPPYLESIANEKLNVYSQAKTKLARGQEKPCPGWFCQGLCEHGHRWAKELYCGREWCKSCGKERGPVHQRRFSRWLSKVKQMARMGYFVLTFAPEDRGAMRTKEDLAEVGKLVSAIMRGLFTRGLRRWHFFGEDRGQARVYHPHLNYLVEGGRLTKETLAGLRTALQEALALSRPPVIHYEYSSRPAKMVHWLRYVTRSTFLERAWDPGLAEEIWNLRNCCQWGVWEKEEVGYMAPNWQAAQDDHLWREKAGLLQENALLHKSLHPEMNALASLQAGVCPYDGTPITWSKAIPWAHLALYDTVALPGGYRAILGPAPP